MQNYIKKIEVANWKLMLFPKDMPLLFMM
jgi:hypothetical protein